MVISYLPLLLVHDLDWPRSQASDNHNDLAGTQPGLLLCHLQSDSLINKVDDPSGTWSLKSGCLAYACQSGVSMPCHKGNWPDADCMAIQKVPLHLYMLSVHPSNLHPMSNQNCPDGSDSYLPGFTLEIKQSDFDTLFLNAWSSDRSFNTNGGLWAPGVFLQGLIETAGAQDNTGATDTSEFQGCSGHLTFQDYGSLADFNINIRSWLFIAIP